HLQRNKIDKTLPVAELIHSVDSARLLEALEQEATKQQRTVAALLEVHLTSEATKQGFDAAELDAVVDGLSRLRYVRVEGLMTMAALEGTLDDARRTFAKLREVRYRL